MLFLSLLGLGLLATFGCGNTPPAAPSGCRPPALAALVLVSGMQLDYLLQLLLTRLDCALAAGGVLAAAGFILALLLLRRRIAALAAASPQARAAGGAALCALLLLMFAVPIVAEPISAWDARSIWYFHGKIIYYGRALDGAGFSPASIGFSHPDYPKLVPVLAAQLARLAGTWNDYLPKASLLALLVPALLGLFSFWERFRGSFVFLAGLFLFSFQGELLWNGLMDGYLALYAGLSLLFLGRWLERGERCDAWCAAAFLGVVLNLKNEGSVYAAVVVAGCSGILWFRDKAPRRFSDLVRDRLLLVQAFLPVSCFLVWGWKKRSWGLANDLDLGVRSLGRISSHLAEGGGGMIAKALVVDAGLWKALLLLVLVLAAAKALRVRMPLEVPIFCAVSLCYFLAIFAVYLATPADLAWHLGTSASRTVLPVMTGVFAAAYVVLERLEGVSRVDEVERLKQVQGYDDAAGEGAQT
jgi:hypothetical protein